MTPIATRILEAQLRKRRSAELVKLAIGAGAYSSSPAWAGRGASPAANPHAVSSATPRLSPSEKAMAPSMLPSLKSVTAAGSNALSHAGTAMWNNGGQSTLNAAANAGSTLWNNGGKQLATPVWNYGGKQLATSGLNAMHGISTVGRGAASTAGGWAGNTLGGAGWLGALGTDALGLTNNGARWVEDNALKHTNNAIGAGMHDIGHGLADTLSGGAYDHDGTFANPGEYGGTAVEQARSGIRDQLGRGSDLDTAFSVANGASDFAADMASTGGAGRGVNVAAKAIRGSAAAAPVLNAAAKMPVVGKPLAATGNWLSGAAPQTNMFAQSMPQYYRSALGPNPTLPRMAQQFGDDAVTAYSAANQPDAPYEARVHKETQQSTATPRQPIDAQSYITRLQSARPEEQGAIRQEFADHVVKNADPQLAQSAAAYQQNPKSPEAELFLNSLGDKRQEFEKQVTADALQKQPEAVNNPDMFGRIAAQAGQAWDAIGPAGQMAMAFGVPAVMLGLLGQGGLGMLLGGLGLGFAGANAGMFGSGAQQFTQGLGESMTSLLGSFFGGGDAAGGSAPSAPAPETYAAEAEKMQQQPQITPPANAPQHSSIIPPSRAQPQFGAPASTQPGAQPSQPAPQLNPQQAQLVAEAKQNPEAFAEKVQKNTATAVQLLKLPDAAVLDLYRGLRPEQKQALQAKLANPGVMASAMYGNDIKRIQELIKNAAVIRVMRKAARCWAGYEPVPGKAPYSENSCRPKATKKKQPRKATHAHKQQNGS
jgi:hypothetical protein